MLYEDKPAAQGQPHSLRLEQRSRLTLTGVLDVESFDEDSIVLNTSGGLLIVRGSALHLERLSIDGGEAEISGRVDAAEYEDAPRREGGLFSRFFDR